MFRSEEVPFLENRAVMKAMNERVGVRDEIAE
jgi:hypothetical protein